MLMGRDRDNTSTFFTRLGFGGKQSSISLSKSLASPAPQTSLSTTYYVVPFRQMLTYLILFSQSSNSRMSSSFPFSLTSPQNRSSPVTVRGSAPSIVCGSTVTITCGRSFYDR